MKLGKNAGQALIGWALALLLGLLASGLLPGWGAWLAAGLGLGLILLLVSGAVRPKWQELALRKELRRVKGERDELERFFDALMEAVPSKIYFKDRESRFLKVNQACAEGMGAGHPQDVCGKTDFDFFEDEHARAAREDELKIMESGRAVEGYIEKETLHGGGEGWVLSAKLPFRDERGKMLGTFGISSDVTEMVRTSHSLERERNILKSVVDSIPDALYVRSTSGRYLLVNEAFARFLGVSEAAEVVGKSPRDFFELKKAEEYLTEDREVMERGEPMLDAERRIRNAQGHRRVVLTSKVPVKGQDGVVFGVVGMNRDVTEARRTRLALEQAERRMKEIMDHSPSSIYVKSVSGRYLMVNRRFEQLFGVKREEVIGLTAAEVMGSEETAREVRRNDQWVLEHGEALQVDETIRLKDGERTFMTSKFPMRNHKGEMFGVGGISTDITERKEAERELKRINEQLVEANENVQRAHEQLMQAEKMESIGRLAAGVAHEVKNPLAMIGMGIDILARKFPEDDEKAHKTVERMKRGIERAKKIVKGLVDFSSNRNLDIQPLGVVELVGETMDLVEYQLRKGGVRVSYAYEKDLPPVLVDRTRVEQVLVNLCINAMHAMDGDGELLIGAEMVERDEVEFDAGSRERERPKSGERLVRIFVRDTGSGIPEEAMGKLFDPFFTTKPTGVGTGLGLSVSHKIAELHGGELTLRNREDGQGAEASLTLRAAEVGSAES
ncbi:MAG: PAS domain-containing protein [Verrucomicrobiales bacterium]